MYYAHHASQLIGANHEIQEAEFVLEELNPDHIDEFETGFEVTHYIAPFYRYRTRHREFLMTGK